MRAIIFAILFFANVVAVTSTAQPPAALTDDSILTQLIDALKDTDPDVRQNLATSIGKFGSLAVEPLVNALSNETAGRRAGAAYSLGQLGSSAKPALTKLLELLKDSDIDVRRQASFAVSRILPTRAIANSTIVNPVKK